MEGVFAKYCSQYEYEGDFYDCYYPFMDFSKINPVYTDFPLLEKDNQACIYTKYSEIISGHVSVPVKILSYGADRKKVLFL